jgi:curli biogenesis system outer membrane secretion channel CsgG
MPRRPSIISAAAIVLVLFFSPAAWAQKKPRIAVLPFDSSHVSSGYAFMSSSVVNGMFETELVKTGKFVVIERKRLEEVMREQNLSLSGALDPTTAVKVGKILGVELMLTGDITELAVRQAGGHSLNIGGSKNTLEGALDVRLISTQTAQIVFAESEKNSDASFKFSAFGRGGGVDFDESKIDKVFRPCVERLTQKMAAKAGDVAGQMRGTEGLVLKIASATADKIYLNAGMAEGLKVGDAFAVFRTGEEIRDPDSGAVLDVEMKLIGKIVVTEVKDKVSIATAQSGAGFQKGDVCKPPKP